MLKSFCMQIIPASQKDFPLLQSFIEPWEFSCTTLSSYIRKQKENLFYILHQNQLFGVIYFDKVLLHCIPFFEQNNSATQQDYSDIKSKFQSAILQFLDGKQLSCIDGSKNTTELILEALNTLSIQPFQTNQYQLMTLENNPVPAPEGLSPDDEIKRCINTATDIDLLRDLQKMYLAKEVAPAGKQITDFEVNARLKLILKEQLCFALYSDGEVVAKANTNAIGNKWVQLGGIYTHPLYRKNYYAWHLIYTICIRILRTNRKITLFVKTRNQPAIQLYTRMGFTVPTSIPFYTISYFK